MDIRSIYEKHMKRHKELFNRFCYIISNDGLEEYALLCTENKPQEQFVGETKNNYKETVTLRILYNDLKNAKNSLDNQNSHCPTEDFTNYKINYNGENYVVVRKDIDGSFGVMRELYCRLV